MAGKNDQEQRRWEQILLIEDNFSRSVRSAQHFIGVGDKTSEQFAVTLHRFARHDLLNSASNDVDRPQTGDWKNRRIAAALSLLDREDRVSSSVVTAGPTYGGNIDFLQGLIKTGRNFAVEISLSQAARVVKEGMSASDHPSLPVLKLVSERTAAGDWSQVTVNHPVSERPICYAAVRIGRVLLHRDVEGWLTLLQTGAILNSRRGAAFVLTSEPDVSFENLVQVAGWVRWIKAFIRKRVRPDSKGVVKHSRQWSMRAIRPVAVTEAEAILSNLFTQDSPATDKPIRLVELFAGAGGMGLGFFLANQRPQINLLYSGEVHPVYAETLRINHQELGMWPGNEGMLPRDTRAVDLRSPEAKEEAMAAVVRADGVDIMIGGPPCQGFSSANRHSWHGGNPHNLLIDTYLSYVAQLQPRIFVMENVQGIVSSPKAGQEDSSLSVLDYFAQQMTQAGYLVFPKLLDASLYGAPQRRNRCFIVGVHQSLGWGKGDFDSWGPFPKPSHGPGTGRRLVTVEEAILDLPRIGNGEMSQRQLYSEPTPEVLHKNAFLQMMRQGAETGVVTDHVTSRHAEYVIERFRKIPTGGNWRNIQDQLTNYANAGRTHSNIYRRLDPEQPSVTIGHYRKSMIVHPYQDRGLSLREAARLQSFPDWFRFAGVVKGEKGQDALGHKQQQLANAVCPLVTKALAQNLFKLLHRG